MRSQSRIDQGNMGESQEIPTYETGHFYIQSFAPRNWGMIVDKQLRHINDAGRLPNHKTTPYFPTSQIPTANVTNNAAIKQIKATHNKVTMVHGSTRLSTTRRSFQELCRSRPHYRNHDSSLYE